MVAIDPGEKSPEYLSQARETWTDSRDMQELRSTDSDYMWALGQGKRASDDTQDPYLGKLIAITLQKGTNKGDQIARMEDDEVSVSHARFMVDSHKFISKYTEVSSRHVLS